MEGVNDIVSSQMDLQPGVVVQAMVLDTLAGRSPLYRLKEFLADRDVELLVGEDLPANAFSDVNVGRSLDAIFEAGPSKIVTALGVRATGAFAHPFHHGQAWLGAGGLCVCSEKTYRAVVIHSSSQDKRRQKRYDKLVASSEKSIRDALKKMPDLYACEPDAKRAMAQAEKLSESLHHVRVSIYPEAVRKRGRPPKHAPAPTRTRYRLAWDVSENIAGVARLRELAGCFVLLSNVSIAGAMDGAGLLRTYKGQYGVESDFAFLKDPLIVNDIFLKTPSRIDALGMVLIIALMVWRLMERSMRTYVKNTRTLLPGWAGRATDKPTSFMMTTVMAGIMVARVGARRSLLCPPQEGPMAFLAAMGLDSNAFVDPGCQCTPIIPRKSD